MHVVECLCGIIVEINVNVYLVINYNVVTLLVF